MYHHQHSHSVGTASQPKRRKKRPIHGVKTVEVTRGKSGYGFTISGQNPCVLSVIVPGSPADVAGLKSGDYLVAVGNRNVTKEPHDDVVRMVGMSTGTLVLQVAENYNSSDSSDDEYQHRHKARYPNRVRSRHATTGSKTNDKVLREHNHRERHKTEYKHKDPYVSKQDPHLRCSQSKGRIPKPTGSENNYTSSNSSHDSTPQFAGPLPIEKRSMISHSNLQATPLLHHPQSKQAVVKTFSQSAQPLRYGAEGRNSEKQSRSNISPSLHGSFLAPGLSSYLKTSAQQNQSNFADNAFLIVDDEEGDDEESLLNYSFHDMRVVVGYIGSIEMPSDAHKPHIRVQSIRSAVRRLRVEQKIHTLVLMEVSQDGVKLTNTMGTTIAHYPASIISFSGVCPDDKRFFGIVTLHSSTSDPESENEENSQAESEASPSGSCHVFMVDPEMKSHNIHAQKAKDFGITCTPNVDRHLCAEFPKSATPVIMSITNLYKDRPGGAGENGVAFSQAFADPSRAPQRSDSNSSNSDSGLGFGVREAPAVPRGPGAVGEVQPRTVQLPRENWSGESVELDQGPVQHLAQPQCSPDVQTMPTPHKLSVQSINTARGTSLTNGHCEFASPPVPVFPERLVHSHETTAKVVKLNENKSHFNSEQNLRANGKIRNSKSMSRTTSHPDLKRTTSAPFNQFSENSAFVNYQHDKSKVETVDMDDRLSPRAMLPPPFHQLRSPSAPPSVGQRIEDSDSDSNDFDFPANTSGMGSLIQRFEQDHALRISSPANVSRRFSEGFAISQQREKEKVPDDSDKWLKPNTVRHRRISRLQQPLSHSHESLVALEHELTNHRLSSAGSVNNIANHVTEDEVKEEDIGRVAGWAVNFDKLLKDVSGLTVFTEFLKKEFSQENIVFWRAVEQYKQINDVDKRKAKAKEIFNTYISVKAADPINIEQTARQQVEKQLDSPSSNAFDRAQQEIFKLMKQDSYPRFIKSELYKSYLMREMEGKALNLPTEEEEEEDKNKGGKKEDKKKKGKDSEDKEKDKEKRRRSLLPWRHKNSKQSLKATSDTDLKKGSKEKDKMSVSASSVKEKEVNNNTQRKPASGPGIDLSTIRKEVQANTKELKEKEVEDKDVKFCRVILPDGSTTVVCTKPGQTIRAVLGKLCDKRGLSIAAVEVLFLGSDKPLDLSEDVSTLGSREVSIERRVLFRMDLANKKSIGVKAKPNRSVRDVFKPILNKYGFKIDSVTVQLAGQTGYVDIEEQVSTIDNQRVVVIPIESTPASNKRTATDTTSKRPPAVVKYPQDMHRWSAPDHSSSLNAITNCIFEDLMMGKYESAHNFDELGILDLTSKVKDHQKGTDDHRSSGLFGLLRKETPSAKLGLEQAKTKTKHKVTFNLQKNQTRRTDPDDDNFFDLLSKVQGDRMEDQRGVGTNDSDMPDFLRNTGLHSGRESAPPILTSRPERMMVDRGDYVQTENKDYISYTRGQISNRPSSVPVGQTDYVNSESNVDIVDGNSSFTYRNQSFSKDGVIPSTEEAEEVFQHTAPDSPDFDDPCLAEKGLRDLGFGYNYNMYQAKAWGYSRHRPNFSSSRHIQNSQFKKVPIASPEQDIFDDPSANHSDSEDDKTLVSSPVDENFRPHSVPPSLGNGAVHYLSPISPHTSPNSHRSTKHSILSTPVKLHQMDQSTPKPNYSKYMSAFQTPNSKKEGVSNKNMNLNLGNSDKAMVVDLGSPTDEESVTFV